MNDRNCLGALKIEARYFCRFGTNKATWYRPHRLHPPKSAATSRTDLPGAMKGFSAASCTQTTEQEINRSIIRATREHTYPGFVSFSPKLASSDLPRVFIYVMKTMGTITILILVHISERKCYTMMCTTSIGRCVLVLKASLTLYCIERLDFNLYI